MAAGAVSRGAQNRSIHDIPLRSHAEIDDHLKGGRITGLWKPFDPLTITASSSYQDVLKEGRFSLELD